MTLGTKIQELRKKQSLSQEAFAEIMGVTRQAVSKWELDQSYPAIDKLVEIADFFHISLDELLREGGNQESAGSTAFQDRSDGKEKEEDGRRNKIYIDKLNIGYFFFWAIMAIIIMSLLGTQEYTAGFVASQILVWTTVVLQVYKFIRQKAGNKEKI